MLLYLSTSKIENLYLEACIKNEVNLFKCLGAKITFKINCTIAEVQGGIDSIDTNKLISNYNTALKYIKRHKLLHEFNYDSYIELFHYYFCHGYIEYNNEVTLPDDINENLNRIIEYKMKIEHNDYNEMLIRCSSRNMKFVSTSTNKSTYSLSLNIELVKFPVTMIVFINEIRSKSIIGTPIIMSF